VAEIIEGQKSMDFSGFGGVESPGVRVALLDAKFGFFGWEIAASTRVGVVVRCVGSA